MEIKTIDYTRHVIGDNIALSFDNFYTDIEICLLYTSDAADE